MFVKLVRIGKDAELRSVGGKAVLNMSVAYDVGYGDNKKTQWMRLAMWGDRAEKLAHHFTKGKQLVIRAEDVHVREFDGKDGRAFRLEATLTGFEFVSDGKREQENSLRAPTQDAHNSSKSNGYQPPSDDVDDGLPF